MGLLNRRYGRVLANGLGAVSFHRRAGDSLAKAAPALVVLTLALAVIVGHVWLLAA